MHRLCVLAASALRWAAARLDPTAIPVGKLTPGTLAADVVVNITGGRRAAEIAEIWDEFDHRLRVARRGGRATD